MLSHVQRVHDGFNDAADRLTDSRVHKIGRLGARASRRRRHRSFGAANIRGETGTVIGYGETSTAPPEEDPDDAIKNLVHQFLPDEENDGNVDTPEQIRHLYISTKAEPIHRDFVVHDMTLIILMNN